MAKQILYPALEEKLHHAKRAINGATSDNIIELCKQYLALLAAYRSELYKLPNTSGINLRLRSSSSPEHVADTRKTVRLAIENTTQERDKTESLLRSFTAVSGYEEEETLNRLRYLGRVDWKLNSGGINSGDDTDSGRLTIQEAVDAASLLRREEHVALNCGLISQSQVRW
jgi:hypothetical protein